MFNQQTPEPQTGTESTESPTGGEAAPPEAAASETPPPNQAPGAGNEEQEKKYQELFDQYTRLAADFDNFRKRAREEQESSVQYGAQKTILELLPVLDNLDRATGSLTENSEPKALYDSFTVMKKQLSNALEKMGVKRIEAVGQEFDPQYHEAVSHLESAEHPENTVMYEAQSGYMLDGKVIRPAMVAVSAGGGEAQPAAPAQAPPQESENPFRK